MTPLVRTRRGTILIVALVCLFIASLLAASFVQKVLAAHRQVLAQQRHAQAFWLAEAGVQRAVVRLESSSDYAGEVWPVAADELWGGLTAGDDAGEVTIRVEPMPDQPQRRRVVVEAQFPVDPVRRTQYRKELLIPVSGSGDSP